VPEVGNSTAGANLRVVDPADDEAERVSLSKLDPVEALKALLAVTPEQPTGDEPHDDKQAPGEPGDADTREE